MVHILEWHAFLPLLLLGLWKWLRIVVGLVLFNRHVRVVKESLILGTFGRLILIVLVLLCMLVVFGYLLIWLLDSFTVLGPDLLAFIAAGWRSRLHYVFTALAQPSAIFFHLALERQLIVPAILAPVVLVL